MKWNDCKGDIWYDYTDFLWSNRQWYYFVKASLVSLDGFQCLAGPTQPHDICTWWHHQMETYSALLVLCAGNSPVTGEFSSQRPVTRSFHVFFDLRLNKRLSKQSRRRWIETSSRSLWRHSNMFRRQSDTATCLLMQTGALTFYSLKRYLP